MAEIMMSPWWVLGWAVIYLILCEMRSKLNVRRANEWAKFCQEQAGLCEHGVKKAKWCEECEKTPVTETESKRGGREVNLAWDGKNWKYWTVEPDPKDVAALAGLKCDSVGDLVIDDVKYVYPPPDAPDETAIFTSEFDKFRVGGQVEEIPHDIRGVVRTETVGPLLVEGMDREHGWLFLVDSNGKRHTRVPEFFRPFPGDTAEIPSNIVPSDVKIGLVPQDRRFFFSKSVPQIGEVWYRNHCMTCSPRGKSWIGKKAITAPAMSLQSEVACGCCWPLPEGRWSDEKGPTSKFKPGQWVRHPILGLCQFGGMLKEYEGLNIGMCFVRDKGTPPGQHFPSVAINQLEPALPRNGEWWTTTGCKAHPVWGKTAHLVSPCNWSADNHIVKGLLECGCLVPVNFGLGNSHTKG